MYPMVTLRGAKVLARRDSDVLCEAGTRTLEIPLDMVWNDDEDLVAGNVCDLHVRKSWVLAYGVPHD